MRNFFKTVSVATVILTTPAFAIDGVWNTGPSGREETAGSSIDIEFAPCAEDHKRFCGTIVKVREVGEASGRDTLPDGSMIVGFEVINGLKSKGDGRYKRGSIMAVDEAMVDGEMNRYGLRVQINDDETITAHGCLGFICPREMTWYKVVDDKPLPYETTPSPEPEAEAELESENE